MTQTDVLTTYVWAKSRGNALSKARKGMRKAGDFGKWQILAIHKTGQRSGKEEEYMIKARVFYR